MKHVRRSWTVVMSVKMPYIVERERLVPNNLRKNLKEYLDSTVHNFVREFTLTLKRLTPHEVPSSLDGVDYLKFFIIPSLPDKQSPMCLLCNKVLGNDAMKPSKLQDHLRRCHPDKTEKDLKYFQTLKDKFQNRLTLDRMFASTSQRNDDGLRATYNISLLIAKSGKPHTIGEKLILPAVEEVLKTVLHKPASDIIKRIPLSNNTVERRIDEMSSDIESFLYNYLQTTHFSKQLDESTLPDIAALLLAYDYYFIEKAIPLSNMISVATDGAPAMVGRYRGFISYLKQNVSGVLAIHCVIHRQHLVAKNLSVRLHESLHLVIDAVNRIRKAYI
ncbi:unnamed protein product [Acanthoscelides obtectus]|uniref:SCAN domain-containing protein 3 n=1 Tax=Acanthoscelides obtectus TaxID=200917 RepID=A0A9P0PBZ3_ACAOB|nr:unnamed protein product [Acanthoscelides obtectus]CAK1664462.1 Protein ZBED8 [Acanthoscelides obtectus]